MRTKVTGNSLAECVKRVKDLEKRGYVCIHPIKKMYEQAAITRKKYGSNHRYSTDNVESVKYAAIMEKSDNGG